MVLAPGWGSASCSVPGFRMSQDTFLLSGVSDWLNDSSLYRLLQSLMAQPPPPSRSVVSAQDSSGCGCS